MTDWALDYVRHVLRETEMSPSALAKKAGIASTTLTRPLNDTSGEFRFQLSRSTITKIERTTGISPAPYGAPAASGEESVETSAPALIGETNVVSIEVSRGRATIAGTIDREGIEILRRKLDGLEALLSD